MNTGKLVRSALTVAVLAAASVCAAFAADTDDDGGSPPTDLIGDTKIWVDHNHTKPNAQKEYEESLKRVGEEVRHERIQVRLLRKGNELLRVRQGVRALLQQRLLSKRDQEEVKDLFGRKGQRRHSRLYGIMRGMKQM